MVGPHQRINKNSPTYSFTGKDIVDLPGVATFLAGDLN